VTALLVVLDSNPGELSSWKEWIAFGCLDGSGWIAALAFKIAVEAFLVMIREWKPSTQLIDDASSLEFLDLRLHRVGVELGGTKPKRESTDLGKEVFFTVLGLNAINDGKRDFFAGIGHVSKVGHGMEVAVEIGTCDTAVRAGIGHVCS